MDTNQHSNNFVTLRNDLAFKIGSCFLIDGLLA